LNKPDAPTLRAAIERVLSDSAFRDAARVISQEMFALHSIDEAAEALVALAAP
jgi:UDP:flavonoid glycosyltransferase YjiC (YdhE family)